MPSVLLLPAVLLLAGAVSAQDPCNFRTTPALRQVARQAAYIFAGRVMAVQPDVLQSPTQVPAVRVTFRVDPAIRGTQTGRTLTIREWAGLWNRGERYRVGERVVLFLRVTDSASTPHPVEGAAVTRSQRQSSGRTTIPIQVLWMTPVAGERPCR